MDGNHNISLDIIMLPIMKIIRLHWSFFSRPTFWLFIALKLEMLSWEGKQRNSSISLIKHAKSVDVVACPW